MNREKDHLEPRQIGLIYHALSEVLTPGLQDQYRGFALGLHSQRTQLDSLTLDVKTLMDPAIQKLQVSTKSAEAARGSLEFAEWFTTWPNFVGWSGGFKAALGNVRVALKFLPIIGVGEHPMISAAKQARATAEHIYQVSIEGVTAARIEAEDSQTQIQFFKKTSEKTEDEILSFSERHAIGSQDVMRKYIGILPQRAGALAASYAQAYSGDINRVPNFEAFNKLIGGRSRKRNKPVPYQHFLSTEDRPLIDTPYHKLPRPIQQSLNAWICYQLKLEWAEAGLIPKPQTPDFLI